MSIQRVLLFPSPPFIPHPCWFLGSLTHVKDMAFRVVMSAHGAAPNGISGRHVSLGCPYSGLSHVSVKSSADSYRLVDILSAALGMNRAISGNKRLDSRLM